MEIYGSATTININRASSSFTHTITYSFSGLTGTIATKTSSTSIGWTIPTSFYAKIPNSKSGVVTINCQTFNGNTSIGTSSTTANVFVINSEPIVDATIEDVNDTTVALTGNSDKMVKYFSNAKVHVTATAKNSATIRGRRITCGDKSSILPTDILYNIESGTFVATCNDTRGFSATKTITKELVEYIKLAFTDISLERPTTTSNTVNAVIKGNYFNANFGVADNTLEMKYRYRQSGGEWSSYATLTATITNNTFTLSSTLGDIYNFNNEYEFEFVITDKLMNVTENITVTRGIPIIDIGENDVKINGALFVKGQEIGTQKILWEGVKFMNENQTIELSEPISAQTNGIVLVFSGYDNDQEQSYNWSCFFIPKLYRQIMSEIGSLSSGNFFVFGGASDGIIGYKYIYISDDSMSGSQYNTRNDDTYNNQRIVLRYVLGV